MLPLRGRWRERLSYLAGPAGGGRRRQCRTAEERHREPLATDIDALAREVADAVSDWCLPPYALYGHSMSARLAHRVVHLLAVRELPLPGLLVVAAHRAPHQLAPLPLTPPCPGRSSSVRSRSTVPRRGSC
ncbi:thioesterase II family protein [Streptomyces sp. NPDC000405]|uniref:thioesterase II family protein n=1 Tax=Streptomyces sp. NPDC000405 TaxID=3161033 RepID=UPI00398CF0F7